MREVGGGGTLGGKGRWEKGRFVEIGGVKLKLVVFLF